MRSGNTKTITEGSVSGTLRQLTHNCVLCVAGDGQSLSAAQAQSSDSRSTSRSEQPYVVHGNALEAGGQGALYESEDRSSSKKPVAAETVKLNIQTQAASLNDRVSDVVHFNSFLYYKAFI